MDHQEEHPDWRFSNVPSQLPINNSPRFPPQNNPVSVHLMRTRSMPESELTTLQPPQHAAQYLQQQYGSAQQWTSGSGHQTQTAGFDRQSNMGTLAYYQATPIQVRCPLEAPGNVRPSRTTSTASSRGESLSRESSLSKEGAGGKSKKDRKKYELKNDTQRSDPDYKNMRTKNNESVRKTRAKNKKQEEEEKKKTKEEMDAMMETIRQLEVNKTRMESITIRLMRGMHADVAWQHTNGMDEDELAMFRGLCNRVYSNMSGCSSWTAQNHP